MKKGLIHRRLIITGHVRINSNQGHPVRALCDA